MENIYDKSAMNYNNASAVERRRIDRAGKYSRAAIVLSVISLLYIAILVFMPPVRLFSVMRVVMLVLDKIFLYVFPIIAVLFGIFGFQERENGLRLPALILSIVSVIAVVVTIIVFILAAAGIIIEFFQNVIDWASKQK
ncbi:MAG: hypothetical protein NC393_11305 [Clostridium sp.]|nr:hypothetical protein [Clostridium sp.]MCM1209765.1 hypothetical protein [Ruminococcus sp.]